MNATFEEVLIGAARAIEIFQLEWTLGLEQCISPDCNEVATWVWTTLPCGCEAPLCDACLKITKRRYDRAAGRLHPFTVIFHPRCKTQFRGHQFNYTFTHI